MTNKYNHKETEEKIKKVWQTNNVSKKLKEKNKNGEKFYVMDMFPYPSSTGIHMGHAFEGTITDALYRYKSMNGVNVFYPYGFDSFGLPAENFAIKTGIHPNKTTEDAIKNYKEQFGKMGISYDFFDGVITSSPEYYKWTQYIFGKFFENNLVYRKNTKANWCESCKTVIANEQVINGKCERCGSEIIQKDIPSWMFKITDFADELIDDLEKVNWPESTKKNQINWIGKSEGAEIDFEIANTDEKLKVFTTRADTVFGATYMVVAPEHKIVKEFLKNGKIKNVKEVQGYIDQTSKKTELERLEGKEKTGVKLVGVDAINPATKKQIPVFISDYVLSSYGTGAIMAVPAHDLRDNEFAKKFDLEIVEVVKSENEESEDKVFTEKGVLVNSGKFDGKNSDEVLDEIIEFVGGEKKSNYRLRDWSVSRQRYWGCPIPIVYDENGNAKFVGEENLPWMLPEDVDFVPDGTAPLGKSEELKERTKRIFGEGFTPEIDTMDTFVDSSWYFLRYPDSENENEFCSKEVLEKMLPVDLYVGGAEHTYLHLLYARFFVKAMKKIGMLDFDEPFLKLRHQGMVCDKDGKKMSKSKGNVVNPDDAVARFGADATRTYLLFSSPLEDDVIWNEDGVVGAYRFLEKVCRQKDKVVDEEVLEVKKELAKTWKKFTQHIEDLKFNTAISFLMSFMNFVDKQEKINKNDFEDFLKMLSLFAPFVTDEISEKNLILEDWPKFDESLIVEDVVKVVVQVNGKKRAEIEVEPEISQGEIEKIVLENEDVLKWLDGKEVKKIIYVKGKLVSVVV